MIWLLSLQASAGSTGGGGILITGGYPTLQYITFDSNVGDSGGGLAATTCYLTISECYFDNNNAIATGTGRGGAIFSEHFERACAIV